MSKAKQWTSPYVPQRPQRILHTVNAQQILYGGAAGGGKTEGGKQDVIAFCISNPGLQAYVFRTNMGELEATIMTPMERELPPEVGRMNRGRGIYEFANGSRIHFCFCDNDHDVNKYLSYEMHYVWFDEAVLFTPHQLKWIRSRNRLGQFQQKLKQYDEERIKRGEAPQAHLLPRSLYTTNPIGGPGRPWLKKLFVDPHPKGMKIFNDKSTTYTFKNEDGTEEKYAGARTIYIPARLHDNKYIDRDYAPKLAALGPEMAKAMIEGDWDSIQGAAFQDLSRTKHQLPSFTPPRHWTVFTSLDWGTASPFAIGWFCVAEACLIKDKKNDRKISVPDGAVIMFHEYYGWNGNENEGCRWSSEKAARKMLQIEEELGIQPPRYRVADSAMWAQSDGPSPAENMQRVSLGNRFVGALTQSKKDRKMNYHEMLARLAGNPYLFDDGKVRDEPMFYITENCEHWWRTVPTLTLDETDPNKGPNTKLEDHSYDSTSYALRSRPFVTTKKDIFEEELEYRREKVYGSDTDPYEC